MRRQETSRVDWMAMKRAADGPDYTFLKGRGVFDRPLSEEEARAIAASIHASYNSSWRHDPSAADMNRRDLQFLPDGKGGYTIGGVPVARNNEGTWVYGNGRPVFQTMYFDRNGKQVDAPTPEQISRMEEEEADTGDLSQDRPEEYQGVLSDRGDVIYNGRGFRYGDLTPELNKRLERAEEIAADPVRDMAFDEAERRYGLDEENDGDKFDPIVRDLDPNGYLAKYGITRNTTFEEGPFSSRFPSLMLIHQAAQLRGSDALREYLKTHDVDLYDAMYAEDERREAEKQRTDMLRQENMAERAAKRWGNSQIRLTPEQTVYWNAKRNLQANPGSNPHWNAYLKAKQAMKPNDLGQVKKYTVQQRMSERQPNGQVKTPAMLQQEWQRENRRRMQEQKNMYRGETQGLKNRTGVQPTPTNPWNY